MLRTGWLSKIHFCRVESFALVCCVKTVFFFFVGWVHDVEIACWLKKSDFFVCFALHLRKNDTMWVCQYFSMLCSRHVESKNVSVELFVVLIPCGM